MKKKAGCASFFCFREKPCKGSIARNPIPFKLTFAVLQIWFTVRKHPPFEIGLAMKIIIKSLSLVAFLLAFTQMQGVFAAELTGCAAKRDSITQQIQHSQDNPQRRISLEKALDEVNAHCTDSALTKQRNRKVISAQVKVNEAERALHKAESEHRPEKKLEKLRAKYEYAKKSLADAEAALKQ
jgi:hypothetical protein